MAESEESYLVSGAALGRIARVTREVETNLGIKPPEQRRKRFRTPMLEGVLLEDLAGTDDPNVPTHASFQIKTAIQPSMGWADEDAPSIIPAHNRTHLSFSAGAVCFVYELYENKWYILPFSGSTHIIEFCVTGEADAGNWIAEVLSYSGGPIEEPPDFDSETCTVEIANSCFELPIGFTTPVGLKGFAAYLYPFLLTCDDSSAPDGDVSGYWKITSLCDYTCSESSSQSSSSSSESSESSDSSDSSDDSSDDSGGGSGSGGGGGSSSDDCEICQWVLIDVEFDPGTCSLIKLWCNRCTGELVRYNPFEPDSGSSASGSV